jgi:hypothetical protein
VRAQRASIRGFVPKPNDFLLHEIIRNNRKRLRILLEQKDAWARILYDPHCKKKKIPAEVRLREHRADKAISLFA